MNRTEGDWASFGSEAGRSFQCGYCDREVSAHTGYVFRRAPDGLGQMRIRLCPHCNRPTYFEDDRRWPTTGFGTAVAHLPVDVESLWTEARDATAHGCYTAAVLLLRKLLMHIAVDLGAAEGKTFVEYVTYLADEHIVSPQASGWTDEVRKRGNEKNHEIKVSTADEARELMVFMEFLLKGVYEFPGELKTRQTPPSAP